MNNLTKQKLWLSITLIITFCLFGSVIFIFVMWVPSAVQEKYGLPGSDLSKPDVIHLSTRLIMIGDSLSNPNNLNTEPKTFLIETGKTAGQIAQGLQKAGFIADADDLILYWQYKGYDRQIRDGVYLMPENASALIIGKNLVQGESGFTEFAFLPGWRKEEIDYLLVISGLIKAPQNVLLKDCYPEFLSEETEIEGFLLPGAYQIPDDYSNHDIYCLFTDRFFSTLPDDFITSIENQGLSLFEAITLASIVEKEMVVESEANRIVGVFINRLKTDMLLQSDPTVQYAIASVNDGPPWWENDISSSDLKVASPYNTYLNNGLPPGPICNPGPAAIEAVANPEFHSYYYFRTACDQSGTHTFSETYEQHLAAACN